MSVKAYERSRMRFPKRLFEITKLEEVEIMKEMGLSDIVKLTWFCHNPVMGLPCGLCNPCKDALNEGFAWRVPALGRLLGVARDLRNRVTGKLRHIFHI